MKHSPFLIFVFAALDVVTAQNLQYQTKSFDFVPNDSVELSFNKFDTQGGTRILTGVTVAFDFTKTGGSLAVDNDSTKSGTISLNHIVQGQLSSTDVRLGTATMGDIGATITAASTTSASLSATTGDSNQTFNATNLSDYYLFQPSNVSAGSSGAVNSLYFGDYVGTGLFKLVFSADQLVWISGLGGVQQSFTVSDVFGSAAVIYSYSTVSIPEPSMIALTGLGLMTLFRRRR